MVRLALETFRVLAAFLIPLCAVSYIAAILVGRSEVRR